MKPKRKRRVAWLVGDRARIGRYAVTLVRRMNDIPGGWEVDPPLEGFRFWNEQDMKRPPRPSARAARKERT